MFKGTILDVFTKNGKLTILGNNETDIFAICQHMAKHYPEIVHTFLRIARPTNVKARWTDGNGNDLPLKVLVADDQFWWFAPTVTAMNDWGLQFKLELYDQQFTLIVS